MEIRNIKTFLTYYERVRERTNRLIAVVPPDKLDWAYMPNKFTIGDQIRHIATIERYMFAEIAAGRKSLYQGCGKELADGYDDILLFFKHLHSESVEIFEKLTDEDLQKNCTTFDNAQMPIWKWLRAMVEHEIHHRAELYLYLNLLHIKTPPIFGFTAEEVLAKSNI
jgi:uncharacterized damage-inducible protein DinB